MNHQNLSLPFKDRLHAAELLAEKLSAYQSRHPLVLAIPRGAVPMAELIAKRLGGDLDLVLTHKIRAPGNPEYAIGALDENGAVYLAPYIRIGDAGEAYLQQEIAEQLALLQQRRAQYTPLQTPLDPAQRTVIIVDDGIATGATMHAALHAIRAKRPAELICAVPVASIDGLNKIKNLSDRLVCLHTPEYFGGVGRFYRDFSAVEDAEVMQILRNHASQSATGAKTPSHKSAGAP